MKIVNDAKRAWTWFSIQGFAIAAAIQTTWLSLPQDMRDTIPTSWVATATIAACVFGAIGRLIQQAPESK